MSEPNSNPYADGGDDTYKWGPHPGYGYPQPQPHPGAGAGPSYQPTLPDGVPLGGAPLGGPLGGAPVPVGASGAPLLSIGDITVLGNSVVTPSGTLPLKGAVWTATDMSRTEEKIPTVAIVLAVVFAVACLLGLLFLLMKEKTTVGFIQVTVSSGGRHHATMIPATGPDSFAWVMGQINYARSLSA